MGHRPVAVVTGASRGIGRSTALGFARAGYDVVVTARSATADGAAFAGTTLDDPVAGVTLPGGLPSLVAEITALGVGCVSVAMDLTDRASVASAAEASLAAFGRVDVLISNAIYQGPGINDPALTVGIEMIDRVVSADAITPLILVQAVLPGMLERGSGVIVHLTSGAATLSPRAPFGKGGWGLAYAIAKGGAHRIVGVLHTEFGPSGVRTYNLNPGHVVTEVGRARSAQAGTAATGQSPEVPAAAAVWLAADNDDTRALAGTDVVALDVVKRFGLNPDAA
ncbi:MAG: oxidoreductase [Ilumatobacteraceae bacterium]|nr:oxidoreductase [Ilumatobacteraceae bacterium]